MIPIVSNRCLDRVQIDLMDFHTKPDGEYKWILQIKDHFSRYIWLHALKDKTATSVAEKMAEWFGQNGNPQHLYVYTLTSLLYEYY